MRDAPDANWTFTRVAPNKYTLADHPKQYAWLNFEQRNCWAPEPMLLHLDPATLWFELVEARETVEVKAEDAAELVADAGGSIRQKGLIDAICDRFGVKERAARTALYQARDMGLIEEGKDGRHKLWVIREGGLLPAANGTL